MYIKYNTPCVGCIKNDLLFISIIIVTIIVTMNQKLLDTWLNLKEDAYKIKNVIYLDWSKKTPCNAIWLDKVPDCFKTNCPGNETFIYKVFWKPINKEVIICGILKKYSIFTHDETKYSNYSFLKSHLQKSIRRGNDNNAVKTAFHMIKMNPNQFLRRLAIIMIEDVVLHDCLGIIVWLTVATSNYYILNTIQVEWLLGVVRILCINCYKDIYKLEDTRETRLYDMLNRRYLELDTRQYSLLYTIHFRESYGGLKCDKKMLTNFCKMWYYRFNTGNDADKLDKTKIRPISIVMDDLELHHWELSAIDFHSAKYFIDIIVKKYPEYTYDAVKALIWKYSSSVNYREKGDDCEGDDDDGVCDDGTCDAWDAIKWYVGVKQKYILYRYSLMDE